MPWVRARMTREADRSGGGTLGSGPLLFLLVGARPLVASIWPWALLAAVAVLAWLSPVPVLLRRLRGLAAAEVAVM